MTRSSIVKTFFPTFVLFTAITLFASWVISAHNADKKVVRVSADHSLAIAKVINGVQINDLSVYGSDFKAMDNPWGEGIFVYSPVVRYYKQVERHFIWLVIDDTVYTLNGTSAGITPNFLMYGQDTDDVLSARTGLPRYAPAQKVIELIFSEA